MKRILIILLTCLLTCSCTHQSVENTYNIINVNGSTLQQRINPPKNYSRKKVDKTSLTYFLRNYELKDNGSPVLLYNGEKKSNQNAHIAVFKLPIENENLQQCADSVIRVYSEYFYQTKQYDKIAFHFVNGFYAEYSQWMNGYRIVSSGDSFKWVKKATYDDSYETFTKYLRIVFAYASTLSLDQESSSIDINDIDVGDIFIKGGSPGHVVMIVDICEDSNGNKAFLLAQGYMPAQEFHILKNPLHNDDPWYYVSKLSYPLKTPEYTFNEGSLKRLQIYMVNTSY